MKRTKQRFVIIEHDVDPETALNEYAENWGVTIHGFTGNADGVYVLIELFEP